MSEGIFYIAYGESHYFREIKRSVESLRKHCDLPIAIFTDRDFQIDGCMSFLIETDIEYTAQPKSTDRFRLKLELLKELPLNELFMLILIPSFWMIHQNYLKIIMT